MDAEFWMKCAEEWQKLWDKSSDNFNRLNALCDEWRKDYEKARSAGDALADAVCRWLAIDERLAREGSSAEIDEKWDAAKFALDDAVRAWRSR